eukprot:1604138-Rhodomonas_salina.2
MKNATAKSVQLQKRSAVSHRNEVSCLKSQCTGRAQQASAKAGFRLGHTPPGPQIHRMQAQRPSRSHARPRRLPGSGISQVRIQHRTVLYPLCPAQHHRTCS